MARRISMHSAQTDAAIRYIKLHWREGRTLKEIAALHGIDPGNLDRIFRVTEGVTEKVFVDKMRAEYVRSKLLRDNVLGYELAAELGFASDFSFYRWVKRVFGHSFRELKQRTFYKK